ncbi:hypothetical protein BOX15_Mlig012907g1 [Macrostomum lignano]|uniref:Uncharacterized protein n=1 Tax=Macrostomum lignano TaxID=282301 RepID=A0A267ELH3_9PLAT|nr:hypothetical protein BOX15_Mlig012907g3 [Macrostomum lignano]PAA62390.1 hypothetical protein BOX15_Mlig012907g2 [Macrostomum lignano]PAA90652.1 hypothetical protein BOX15_Mlig012907g1 [Macrostomum lignano]
MSMRLTADLGLRRSSHKGLWIELEGLELFYFFSFSSFFVSLSTTNLVPASPDDQEVDDAQRATAGEEDVGRQVVLHGNEQSVAAGVLLQEGCQ